MNEHAIYITEMDLKKLRELIFVAKNLRAAEFSPKDAPYLDSLRSELDRATVVPPKDIPPDVITMTSKVRIKDLDSGEESVYSLVFPENADIDTGRISILAPIGTALIGYRIGDTIEWKVPAGTRRLKVEAILYQPEASGDYHL